MQIVTSRNRAVIGAITFAVASVLLSAPQAQAARSAYVVMTSDDGLDAAAAAVERFGGDVTSRLPAIDGLVVSLTPGAASALTSAPGVRSVTADTRLDSNGTPTASTSEVTVAEVAKVIKADRAWARGARGQGVDIALIDTGVIANAVAPGQVVNGPDYSATADLPDLRHLDAFGHGTHLAGIILGIAPDARVINVKTGDQNGATSLVRVIQALEWTVRNARTDGRNIRVINVSLGVPATSLDPLNQAMLNAYASGIVVVAAAGNGGVGAEIDSPAYSRYSIAVGASDPKGTIEVSDDEVAAFSSRGVERGVDVLAPGVSIASTRVTNSHLDLAFPGARSGSSKFRGSGTSQATAVAAGAVALLASYRPYYFPVQLRNKIESSAAPLPAVPAAEQGSGEIDVDAALTNSTSTGIPYTFSTYWNTTVMEFLMGRPEMVGVQGVGWQRPEWTGNRWTGNRWTGNRWTGENWG